MPATATPATGTPARADILPVSPPPDRPMRQIPLVLTLAALFSPATARAQAAATDAATGVRVLVDVAPQLAGGSRLDGRLFVVFARGEGEQGEPRAGIGTTGIDASPVAARDVRGLAPGRPALVDGRAIAFPLTSLDRLPAGAYRAQAVLKVNHDLKELDSEGNLYSDPLLVRVSSRGTPAIRLTLTHRVPDESLPADGRFIKYLKVRSALLSAFWRRPIYLRAGVILPRDFYDDTTRRFPLRVHIGGYGVRFTGVERLMRDTAFRAAWSAVDVPSMIVLQLDGDGPLGDPYQVNSDNHGPYGDAVTTELIPYVERTFRGIGSPASRVVDGGSTGGWVSLALQVFYPDFFNGVWSYCPDGVDFRGFQLVDIYADTNAYVNRHGFERPSARDVNGDVRFTMRHELQMENVIGDGDSWTMSGGQWGAWNATYGARGADGRPVALWDPRTGHIDRGAAEHWKRYDLRAVLEQNWATLGPRLRGKIRIWVGDADDYFLNNAVHMLDDFLERARPAYEGSIVYGPGKGHCWNALTPREMMLEMGRRTSSER